MLAGTIQRLTVQTSETWTEGELKEGLRTEGDNGRM